MPLTRRAVLAGLAASLPAAAEARITKSRRPKPRPGGGRPSAHGGPSVERILSESGYAAITGFVVRDLATGRMLEQHQPQRMLPPGSVAKAATALYALHTLGAGYQFRTLVAVTGPVAGGRVQGDLYLVGGGDPHLDTDGLAALAEAVAQAGIYGVNGNAYVVSGALPYHLSIDPGQPDYVGYNPAISGLNLNFNRVHFEWKPAGGDWALALTARGTRFDPAVRSVEMRVVDRAGPVFDYRMAEGRDLWSVSARALGKGGARWLPVRAPAIYAAEVFRIVAQGYNLRLPELRAARGLPKGARVVAETRSAALGAMSRAMLKYSTNLTAEVTGLRAAQAQGAAPGSIAASGQAMTGWLRERYGLGRAALVNHSGLTDRSRMSAAGMVQMLDAAAAGPLPGLLKEIPLLDANGARLAAPPARARAKTGTLNFARGLAGYLDCRNGRRLAFAIFAADMERRERADASAERPSGSGRWKRIAKAQEQSLLRRWAAVYGA